jgi:serine/threonine protein kinase
MIGKKISHYHIMEKIGEGGMGAVYRAEDTKLKRTVALKFLPFHLSKDSQAKERFIHEAQAAAALDHPNICDIHEIGEDKNGQMYICMSYYEGKSLYEISKPLPINRTLNIVIQIAQGLYRAHKKGIIHRDIKPANIIVTNDGAVKILDFGLAKLSGQTKITRESTKLGTMAYMSPEQIKGETADKRSDIWSLGVLFYEMLTGKAPFSGDFDEVLFYSILHTNPKSMSSINTEISPQLEYIVYKALAKNPKNRYQTLFEFISDLQRIDLGFIRYLYSLLKTRQIKIQNLLASKTIKILFALSIISFITFLIFWFAIQKTPDPQNNLYLNQKKSIAVMPFENLTADPRFDIWQEGFSRLLSTALATSDQLEVRDSQTLFDIINNQKKKNGKQIYSHISEIGSILNVSNMITGEILKWEEKLRLQVRVQETKNEQIIYSDTVERDINVDFMELAQALSSKVKNFLEIKELREKEKDYELRNVMTMSSEAYSYYLQGMEYFYGEKYGIEMAIRWLKKALSIDPDFIMAKFFLAYSYIDWAYEGNTIERLREGRKWHDEAYRIIDKLPLKEQLLLRVQHCEFEKTPYERIKWLNILLEIDSQSFEAVLNLGWTYYRLRQYEQALKHLRKAIDLSVHWESKSKLFMSVYWLSRVFHKMNNHLAELQIWIDKKPLLPDNVMFSSAIASAYMCVGDTNQANIYLAQIQKKLKGSGASDAKIYTAFGCIFDNADKLNQAEIYYRRALILDSAAVNNKGQYALCMLAILLVKKSSNITEGIYFARQALKIDPENYRSWHALGWGYYKLGKIKESISALEKADALIPKYDHNIRLHLETARSALETESIPENL